MTNTMLITGANRGIGLEFVRQYAADGWRVLACCRHPDKSVALTELAKQHPGQVMIHALDVADHAQIEQLAKVLSNEAIDLLMNNAGVYPASDKNGFGRTDYAEWMTAFSINAMAPLKMVEAFVDQIARSRRKLIVTITSQMGSVADNSSGGSYLYRSSKAAANIVVKSLAIDLKDKGITAVAFNPGWVKTDMGGPNAMIPVEQSVADMRRVISRLGLADSGKFIGNDGIEIPW
ncbi:SDR family oxidoreductase [Sideroxydans lithotrophicus]|uniref:Short-chain dehydrogenase/reductase SDR n=1 Tax=Sideroxydans lithotrophicus (strain ES-1) TaxID=580332 RepID=D5CM18_SIDLE|nr:SDR family oxidoreductase [Sideroxydans lithotrophicus]ADE10632.1 short-chain dehydrogenase/reductase SDR [Sideroxydans lithotrophicus ES-1]